MSEMIERYKTDEVKPGEEDFSKAALLNSLVQASEEESASGQPFLSHKELMGTLISIFESI